MWGEDGISVAVLAAFLVLLIAVAASFALFEGSTMLLVLAVVIGTWLAALAVLGARYNAGRWPFGRSDPYDRY